MYLILTLTNKVLLNPKLSTVQKIEMIKTEFNRSTEVRFDITTGRYFEADLTGFVGETYLKKYLEKTKGLAVNMGGRCGWTLLAVAAQEGQLEVSKFLVEELGANVNHGNDWGQSPLLIAAGRGQIEVMRYLISKGADVNLGSTSTSHSGDTGTTCTGTTPLHHAIRYGQIQAVQFLIANGALIKKVGDKRTPIEYGYYILNILSNLKNGIKDNNICDFGDEKWRDNSKIPTEKNIKIILILLEAYYKRQSFFRITLSEFHFKNKEKEIKRNKEEVSLDLDSMTEEDRQASLVFTRLIKAKHKVLNRIDKKSQIPTDCEFRILSFLYGDFGKYRAVPAEIIKMLKPITKVNVEDNKLDSSEKNEITAIQISSVKI